MNPRFEDVANFHALWKAGRAAARGKRITRETAAFLFDLELEVLTLERELLAGRYVPRGYRTFTIREPKLRTISAAAYRDRVVHHALCGAMEPVLESLAVEESFACRRGKGSHRAIDWVQGLTRSYKYFLKLDIEHFFETMDHGVLKKALREVFTDERLVELADRFVDAGAPGSPSGKGQPIGNLTSQHFANFYLTRSDWFLLEEVGVKGYCRYMDDMLIFGDDKKALWRCHQRLEAYLGAEMKVKLKDSVTMLAPVTEGVAFLGFRIWPGMRRLDGRRVRRFRRQIRQLDRLLDRGEIDEDVAASSAASLLGWAGYSDVNLRAVLEGAEK